jgi:hypothetical protein
VNRTNERKAGCGGEEFLFNVEEEEEKEGSGRITTITGMGNKYYKREANTSINRINIMKKGDDRFRERNDKQMGR